jgi:RNA polymerase sigma-70 factor (ECF subfamily)
VESLVLRSQDGDGDALAELISRWQDRLWRHARRLLRDDAAAWDVLQEAWMNVLRGLRRLNDPAAFAGWAYRIVTFKCVDFIRRHRRERAAVSRHAPSSEPEEDADADVAALRAALGELSVEQRAVLSLHYMEGMKIERIADVLGVPAGTVKSRLHHARAALKKRLERRDG